MRLLLTVFAFLLLCSLPPAAAEEQQYACESLAVFVEPRSNEARRYSSYMPQPWQEWQKRKVDYALEMVKSLAPGLVSNACVGGKIRLINCGRAQDDLLQSYLMEIYVYPKFWNGIARVTPWSLADMFVHELTHMVDNGNDLSRSSDWQVFTGDRVMACRKKLGRNKERLDVAASDFFAQSCGLPSAYAVQSPPESLAESVSASIFSKSFHLPTDMAEFVQKRVLAPQPYTRYNEFMHKAWEAELDRDFSSSADLYKQALTLDPLSVRARQGLVSCLIQQGRTDDALNELRKLEAQLQKESALSAKPTELQGVRAMIDRLTSAHHKR